MSFDVALRSVSKPLPSLKLLNDALGDPLGCDIKKAEKRGGELLGGASPGLVSIQSRPSLRFSSPLRLSRIHWVESTVWPR
jgi:hypothetical protein